MILKYIKEVHIMGYFTGKTVIITGAGRSFVAGADIGQIPVPFGKFGKSDMPFFILLYFYLILQPDQSYP